MPESDSHPSDVGYQMLGNLVWEISGYGLLAFNREACRDCTRGSTERAVTRIRFSVPSTRELGSRLAPNRIEVDGGQNLRDSRITGPAVTSSSTRRRLRAPRPDRRAR